MISSNLFKLSALLLIFANVTFAVYSINITWCATDKELTKCVDFMRRFGYPGADVNFAGKCITGQNAADCIKKIEKGEADFVTLDGGHTFTAGKYHNLVPVVAEDYGGEVGTSYYAVAVVKKNNTGFDITSLKGKKSCHTGANKTAGWNIPVGFLLAKKLMKMNKCCNPFTSVGNFFNSSCIPGALSESFNPAKGPSELCSVCDYGKGGKCGDNEPFSGYGGAFMCMAKGYGDVAFVKHTTVNEMVTKDPATYGKASDYQYLCPNGGRKEIGDYKSCSLGRSPSHVVMTGKDGSFLEAYKAGLLYTSERFGINQTNLTDFQMFNSTVYKGKDLLFKDSTVRLVDVGEKNTYDKWLGKQYQDELKALLECSTNQCPTHSTDPTDHDKDIKGNAGVTSSLAVLVFFAVVLTVLSV